MSANSLVVSSLLSLLSTVSSTTTSYVLHIVRHVESIKNFMSAPITTAYDILVEENSTEVIHSICQLPPWSSPPGCPCRPRCCRPPTHMIDGQTSFGRYCLLAILHQCSAASHVLHFDLDHRKIVRDHENWSSGLESSQILLCGFYGLWETGYLCLLLIFFFGENSANILHSRQIKLVWQVTQLCLPIGDQYQQSDQSLIIR